MSSSDSSESAEREKSKQHELFTGRDIGFHIQKFREERAKKQMVTSKEEKTAKKRGGFTCKTAKKFLKSIFLANFLKIGKKSFNMIKCILK